MKTHAMNGNQKNNESSSNTNVQDLDKPFLGPIPPARLSVRVDPELAVWLLQYSKQNRTNLSDVVRNALRQVVAPERESHEAAKPAVGIPATSAPYHFPPQLAAMLAPIQTLGAMAWIERRRRFGLLLAAAEVTRQTSGNDARDLAICTELLSLGTRFGML